MLKLGGCDGRGLLEVAVAVQDFVDFVFNLSLEVELFQEFGNGVLNFIRGISGLSGEHL